MSANDRIEMSEEMANFWAEVKDWLPGPLKQVGFVSVYPLADPDDVDIFTVWWNGMEEHIASLYQVARFPRDGKEDEEPKFNLLVDEPGTDGRTLAGVDARRVARIITERAADQVRAHLPGTWSTGRDFTQDGAVITMFEDAGSGAKNMGEYTEYVQERADRFLARRAFTTLIDLLLLEEVPFTTASFPSLGMNSINLLERTIKIRTERGRAEAVLSTLEGEALGSVDITMGPRGVSYPFCTMQPLIYDAISGGRSEEENR
jgi:hypothetical protein